MIAIGVLLLAIAFGVGVLGVIGVYKLGSKLDDTMMAITTASAITGFVLLIMGALL